jgi:acyl carrier protein
MPDRKQIAKPASHPRPPLSTAYVEPANAVEQRLVEEWQKLLGIEPVGTSDNFFELGGHSLLAIQVISRVWETFGVRLTLAAFFEFSTPARIAGFIASSRPASSLSEPSRRSPAFDSESIPLSFAQQQLWVLDRIEGKNARYNEFGAHEIRGPLNVAALEQSLTEIVRAHEGLRTSFPMKDGSPFQRISPAAPVSLPLIDFSALNSTEKAEQAERLAEHEARQPFDLGAGPLLRFVLLRLDEDSHLLYITVHHIVFDGWSGVIFIENLMSLYESFSRGATAALPELPIQYADFSIWHREWFGDERREDQLRYWKRQLAGVRGTLALPYDRPRPAARALTGRRVSFQLDCDTTRDLKALGQQAGATLFMAMLSAYAILLHRYTGQEDMIIGAPIANRRWKNTESLIGYFVNTLLLRIDLGQAPSFSEVLSRVRRMVLEGHEASDLPFEQLVAALHPERDATRNPMFQVLFIFRNALTPLHTPSGLSVRQLESERVPLRSDLDFYLSDTPDGMTGYFIYDPDLFEHTSIERVSRRLKVLVRKLLESPGDAVSDLPMDEPVALPAFKIHGISR